MAIIGPKQPATLIEESRSIHHARKSGRPSSRVDDSEQRFIGPAEPEHWASDNPSRLDGGRAGVDGRAAKLRAAAFAVGCACVASTNAVAAHRGGTHRPQPPPTYSQAEIDHKIDQLRQDILSNVPTKQDLQDEVGKFYTKSDVDGLLDQIRRTPPPQAITQPELNAVVTKLNNDIQDWNRQLSKILEDQMKKVNGRTSTIPSWVSLGVSLASLCAVIWVGWRARASAAVSAAATKARFIPRTEAQTDA
jgi:hypothetical protein